MKRCRALLVLAVALAAVVAQLSGANPAGAAGESFTANTALNSCDGLAAAWGDYDTDGWLDLLTTPVYRENGAPCPSGTPLSATSLYRNNSGTFSGPDGTQSLPRVVQSSAAWSDYDNDGKLEFLLIGILDDSVKIARLYKQNGSGVYEEDTVADADLPGVAYGSVAWGDYNNDGKPDILLSGRNNSSQPVLKVFTNNGPGTAFTEDTSAGLVTDPSTFPGVFNSSVAWGDYTGDGYLDILATGNTGLSGANGFVAKLFTNNSGGGTFSEDTTAEASLTPVCESAVAWGDYDNDGDLDILLAGCNGVTSGVCSSVASKLYTNSGGTSFSEKTGTGLTDVQWAALAWGDYNSDGKSDILLSGANAFGIPYRAKAYTGDGAGVFTADSTEMPYVAGTVGWGDYDSDRRLDAVVAGGASTNLFHNVLTAQDTAPTVPTNPTASAGSYSATFSWTASTDTQQTGTPNGLTYNLCVGTTTGHCDVVSPLSKLSDGKLLVPRMGNAGERTSYTLTGLTPGTHYYWRVQAVDSSFVGSAFSAEKVFTAGYDANSTSLPGVNNGAVAFGDYDSDGDLDAVVTGTDSTGVAIAKVYYFGPICHPIPFPPYEMCLPGWRENTSANLTPVSESSAAWGDYDNDGKLDLLISGYGASGPVTTLYRGSGNGGFTPVAGAGLTGVFDGSATFGDYNSDGRPDILLTGAYDGSRNTTIKLYRNDGGSAFSDVTAGSGLSSVSFPGVQLSSTAWGDYNRDGKPDILIAGCTTNTGCVANPVTKLFRNDGSGSFSDVTTSTGLYVSSSSNANVIAGSLAWGDYNSDGWSDILVTGWNFAGNPSARVYTNVGGSSFSENTSAGLPGVALSSAVWGDHDADGMLDILLTGGFGGFLAAIYENEGGGAFADIGAGLTGVSQSSAVWGDYNADGDLDLLVGGCTNSPTGIESCDARNTTLYMSSMAADAAPTAPGGLAASPSGSNAALSWNAAGDAEQSGGAGLSYNVRVGTTPGATNVVSPLALASGTRLVPATGNAGERTSYSLTGLTHGQTYYWSVQAVDNSFLGSAFATEGSFLANDAPTASAGGPYAISEGQQLQLSGSASDPNGDGMSYLWKINGAGSFSGQSPAIPWSTLESMGLGDGPASLTASLQVTDSYGASSTSTATVTLNNAAPSAAISGSSSATVGESDSWTFSATDPSSADQAGAFTYAIDWNGDGSVDQTVSAGGSTSVSRTFSDTGSKIVTVTASDKNGGKSAEVAKAVTVMPGPTEGRPAGKIASGKIASAKLSKKTFTAAQANKVKLTVTFSPKSERFKWVISLKHGKKWQAVKSAAKNGSFKKKTMTVKALFSGKKMRKGIYKLKLSADKNSRTLSFKIK